jgi:holo-[acyl-carrier protein] synthase
MIGVDVVDIERLRAALARNPRLEERLFTKEERLYCHDLADPFPSFAGTLAAKEAAIKALRLGPLAAWARRIAVSRDREGVPTVRIEGLDKEVQISISHDGGVAVAVALSLPPL